MSKARMKKQVTVIILAMAMLFTMMPTSIWADSQLGETGLIQVQEGKIYKNGTFEGVGSGYSNEKQIRVNTTIANDTITVIDVLDQGETADKWELAKSLLGTIIEKNSTKVDSISGATVSSGGIKDAVNDALSKAIINKDDGVVTPGGNGYLGVKIDGSKVPTSFTNDIWLQYDFKELNIGEKARIYPRRLEQGVTNTTTNDLERPNFKFEIIEGDSIKITDEKKDNKNDAASVEAIKTGDTVVKVTYDGFTHSGGKTFSAIDPINTAYVVFSVGGSSTITIDDTIKLDSSYDTIYYKDGEKIDFPCAPTINGAKEVKVFCNGLEITKSANNEYLLPLENRSNIIAIKTKGENDGIWRNKYRVIDARKIEVKVENETVPGFNVATGDEVKISFNGIVMPVYKLATIYNPQFGKNKTSVVYKNDTYGTEINEFTGNADKVVRGQCGQWDLATNNSIKFTAGKAETVSFTGGYIRSWWWGEELGADKLTEGLDPNLNAADVKGSFSVLPDFDIQISADNGATKVTEVKFGKGEITLYNGTSYTEAEIKAALGGITVTPSNATNQSVAWSSSDNWILSTRRAPEKFSAMKITSKDKPVILTATTIEGKKTATCKVHIIEGPATDVQKKALIDKIAEAKKLGFFEGASKQWEKLKDEIIKSEKLLIKNAVTGKETKDAIKTINNAMKAYKKAVDNLTLFKNTVIAQKVKDGVEITLNFPNLPLDKGDKDTTSLKLIYSSNIPNMVTVTSEEAKEAKENVRTIKFTIPKGVNGTFKLSDGYIKDEYEYFTPFPSPHMEKGTNEYYRGEMPDVSFKISENGSILPPVPTEKEKVSLSIDKHTIAGGYVVETTTENLRSGDTAWDVTKRILDANGITYDFSYSPKFQSVYVSAIGGVSEFDYGPGSGWMYSVNGVFPSKGCDKYVLKNGEQIKWRYTTNLGQDIGAGWNSNDNNDTLQDKNTAVDTPTTIKDGVATATLDKAGTDKLIEKALKDKSTKAVINIIGAEKSHKLALHLTKDSIKALIENMPLGIEIATPLGNIGLDKKALMEIYKSAEGEDITISLTMELKPTTDTQGAVGKDAYIINIEIKCGDKIISNLNGGDAELMLTVPAALKGKDLVAVYINEKNQLKAMDGKITNKDGKTYYGFRTGHFSTYAIAEKAIVEKTIKEQEAIAEKEKLQKVEAGIQSTKITSLKAKASKGKVIVTWKKSKGYKVDGYQIYKSTKKTTDFKKMTTKTNRRYVNTKSLKSGKTYFYKVRGYRVIDGKTVYTKWGKVRVKSI
ncbi:MAG: DUF4430 domain-containing protein [Anaerovoracaceae bacterium]